MKPYGLLKFPPAIRGRPYIVGNFVSTLDGVVSFLIPGKSSGRWISGHSEADAYVLGLLRVYADAVIFGSGTINEGSGKPRIPATASPAHTKEFTALRKKLGKRGEPLNVVLTRSGDVDLSQKLFHDASVTTLVMTTDTGVKSLRKKFSKIPQHVHLIVAGKGRTLSPKRVASLLYRSWDVRLLVHEGGPTVFGEFLKDGLIDELFLTIAPHIAGRSKKTSRPSFAGEALFSPEHSLWYKLVSIKKVGDHIFTRYRKLR